MSDDRSARRQAASTLPGAAEPAAPQPDEAVNGSYSEVEPIEDTVPYLPPLASYPIQIQITDIRRGVPHIYPDEILEEDE
jgi:hypothetical protein